MRLRRWREGRAGAKQKECPAHSRTPQKGDFADLSRRLATHALIDRIANRPEEDANLNGVVHGTLGTERHDLAILETVGFKVDESERRKGNEWMTVALTTTVSQIEAFLALDNRQSFSRTPASPTWE